MRFFCYRIREGFSLGLAFSIRYRYLFLDLGFFVVGWEEQ